MKIKTILDEIANESSTNQKMEILSKYKDNELLKRVLYLAKSKRIKFYLKQIPEYTFDPAFDHISLEDALNNLEKLSSRTYTGHQAIEWLQSILNSLTPDDAYVIERIIEKDLKFGMGTSNINKKIKDLIEETSYMGAKPFEEKLAKAIITSGKGDPAYSQIKMDGRYANAIIRGGEVELESRQGEPTTLEGAKFLEELAKFDDCVLNGELTMDGVPRYESNGLISSLIKIGQKKSEGKDIAKDIAKFNKEQNVSYTDALAAIRFTVWDTITVDEYYNAESKTPYFTRLVNLIHLMDKVKPTMVTEIETRECETYDQAMAHFQEVLEAGMEGTILKAFSGTWKDGKPNWQVKMKLEMDVDMKIVGYLYGEKGTKNEHVISRILGESMDGIVKCKAAGLSEAMMVYVTENQDKLLGTIFEVTSCGMSKNSKGEYSLLHPRFKALRDDKNTGDTFESIVGIEAMVKGLVTK